MDYRYSFELSNKVRIPAIGFGTGICKGLSKQPIVVIKRFIKEKVKNVLVKGYKESNRYTVKADLRKDRSLRKIARVAAENGCVLFDTARAYQFSEEYLGESLFGNNSDLKREEFFIITKATNLSQRNDTVRQEFEMSLKNLRTEYVDLYLLHWPQTNTYIQQWKVMEDIYRSGRAKAIGICNCNIHHLEELKKTAKIMPMVNELECHPMLQQKEVREYCQANNIQIIAHTPTGKMCKELKDQSVLPKIAGNHNVSVSQVILRWHYQLGDVSIPNTTSAAHIIENLDIFGFSLSDEEMNKIATLDCDIRIWPDPDNCDFTKL